MNSLLSWREKALERGDGVGLLAMRLLAGQEFLLAGWTKMRSGVTAPDWFTGLDFPFPLHLLPIDANWVSAGLGEITLGLALILGLFSRFAAVGLLFITYVAVYTVHFDLGWAGWNQIDTEQGLGFKVPLMLAAMLLAIATQGGGQYALDTLLSAARCRRLPDTPALPT